MAEGVRGLACADCGLMAFITRGLAMVLVVVVCSALAAAWAEEPLGAAMGAWG